MPLTDLSELKSWRNKYAISQEKLARISDLGVNTIAKIETGAAHLQGQTSAKLMKAVEEIENDPQFKAQADLDPADNEGFDIATLKDWRSSYGITQEKLARLANLGVNTVAKVETGDTQVMPQTTNKLRAIVKQVESGVISIPKPESTVDHMAGFDPNELRAWRKKHGLSQEKLANLANLGVNTVLKLEGGVRVEKNTLLTIMQAVKEFNKVLRAAPAPEPAAETSNKIAAKPVARSVAKRIAKPVAKPVAKPAVTPKTTSHVHGSTLDLKSWRKRFGISQGKLAQLAQLSLNTVMKLEAGAKEVQRRTLDRLFQAIKSVEGVTAAPAEAPAAAPPAEPVAPSLSAPVVAAPVTKPAEQIIPLAAPTRPAVALQLSNLDLELINRVILMSTKEKLRILELMMERDSDA